MKNCLVNQRYNVVVPDHIADWDAPSEWERARFLSMEKHLKKGDVLYDVGAEQGWQSAIYAQFVGGENMVLIEPSPEFWPNIRKTWEANKLPVPLATLVGFASSTDMKPQEWGKHDVTSLEGWPRPALGKQTLERAMPYRYLHEHKDIPFTSIDTMACHTGVVPTAISIDVEGAELEVLKGAEQTLKERKPKVWISVHPDLMKKDYDTNESQLRKFLTDLGYEIEDLGWDGHETHWYCHV